jgi:hypothetical protein
VGAALLRALRRVDGARARTPASFPHHGERVTESLWTPADVVAYFAGKVTEKTLANWRSLGEGPPYLKLPAILYRPAAVVQWALTKERNSERAA